ncbi:MAG: methylenetetrahydrofolate--tRNA-(uracil(54)-C(5))-methyltransferase (FADH(2)-oxidizing) TrmFO [Deltaproteobacteria bacterium]|nr:methylenetetrahydrofolate--tRNA-(uracil(54)-C(5))-methyltransferase (FADH(2)-oxidizing) TrmFO [Deltaproteobacteria bacterium]
MPEITVIGGGLAGCEAAFKAAEADTRVTLVEMKPHQFSPAHHSPLLAELVCSNSFRAGNVENAVGLLKEEMRRLSSIIMAVAVETAVPAGRSLAVDREKFATEVTDRISGHKNIRIIHKEVRHLPQEGTTVLATGPLTSDALAEDMEGLLGEEHLHFYDAIAPLVTLESIDFSRAFYASRYEPEEGDYINCPMTREEYEVFFQALTTAQQVPLKPFETPKFFEGCLPVEVMAERGFQTLLFGPMKPVGLIDPTTGQRPFAVVQLRKDNTEGTIYNMVGFQTKLAYEEQERVFRLIPGLRQAEFVRLGSIHRNTFINGPRVLTPYVQFARAEHVFVAGQISGVEGYVESAAMGLLCGINAARLAHGQALAAPPRTTALGSLVAHITASASRDFQPMNVNFGLFPPLEGRVAKKERGAAYARRALADLDKWITEVIMG